MTAAPIADSSEVQQSSAMRYIQSLLLAFMLTTCGQVGPTNQKQETSSVEPEVDVRSEFLRLAANDPWAKWPERLTEDPAEDGHPCERVSEQAREQAIARLAEGPSLALDALEYERLTGVAPPAVKDTFYLLRGFSSSNSMARVKVTGNIVTVHSDALGGLFNVRRHPCIAALRSAPSEVYTVAGYDL